MNHRFNVVLILDFLCNFNRSVPVPYHKGKDDELGFFAKEILKEANIDPKTLKEVRK